MDLSLYYANPDEKPLDRIVDDGGMTAIFRTIACIGDSLSSGEFESTKPDGTTGYHDYYEYSWGQFLGRMIGAKVYNFSKGGMTAQQYLESFADKKGFWGDDKLAQAYIMALGVNDILNKNHPLGSKESIDPENWRNNDMETFAGRYAAILQRYREAMPKSRFFLVTIPRSNRPERDAKAELHAALLHDIASLFEFTYVIDLNRYAPVFDEKFRSYFNLASHMNPTGYLLVAKIIGSYIDYIIRNNPEDFKQVGFIGTPHHSDKAKW